MNKYKMELYLEKGQRDYNGIVYDHDRYIILDSNGFDCVGEHEDKASAIITINYLLNN